MKKENAQIYQQDW